MPFVKLDTNILNSTLWFEKACRDIFLTALLMAEPVERTEPEAQLEIRTLNETGWIVPPGKYGFVPAASVGIIRRAILEDQEIGLDALEKLGNPEEGSRTAEYDGRRLVRVDGGFVVLNYFKYREQDYTSAARSKRYRERKKEERHAVASLENGVTTRNVTPASASASAWLEELKKDEAYKDVDVQREYSKAVRWCKENRRELTRRFFINWLNKADRKLPMFAEKQITKYDLPLPKGCSIRKYDGAVLDAAGRVMDINDVRKAQ